MSQTAVGQDVLRGFTERVQRDTAVARDLTEEVRTFLVSSRNAVDGLEFPKAYGPCVPAAAPAPTETYVTEAAQEVAKAAVAVAEGRPGDNITRLLSIMRNIIASEQLTSIRAQLTERIVAEAAGTVHASLPHLGEESLKLLMKVAIQSLRGTLDRKADQITEALPKLP